MYRPPEHRRKDRAPPRLIVRGINRRFLGSASFLDTVRQKVSEANPNLPTILLFPESALHGDLVLDPECPKRAVYGKAIPRHEGKRIASDIHKVLMAAGKPVYVAYSLIETKPARTRSGESYPLVTNSGYLVMPEKSNNHGYMVYPKVTTYNNGTTLTDYDINAIKRNSEMPDASISGVCRLSRKIHRFPRVNINGKIVELRLCSDVDGDPADEHPARTAGERPHLIVVPSSYLNVNGSHLPSIKEQLRPDGSAVILDYAKGTLITVSDKNFPHYYDFGSHRHGDMVIDHQPC